MITKRRSDPDRSGAPAAPPAPRDPPPSWPPASDGEAAQAAPPPRDPRHVDGDLIDA
jgi:hypothetical protein